MISMNKVKKISIVILLLFVSNNIVAQNLMSSNIKRIKELGAIKKEALCDSISDIYYIENADGVWIYEVPKTLGLVTTVFFYPANEYITQDYIHFLNTNYIKTKQHEWLDPSNVTLPYQTNYYENVFITTLAFDKIRNNKNKRLKKKPNHE